MKKMNLLFLLFLFLLPSLMFGQNVIQIGEGINGLDDSLFVAQPGDIIELTTNGGVYYEYFSILIDMPITIRAAEGLMTKPKIITDDPRGIFTVRDDLTLIGVELTGLGGNNLTDSGIRTDSMNVKDNYNLTVEDCYFHDFESSAIKANTNTIAGDVTIDNCLFFNIGIAKDDEGIYFKNGERAPGSVTNFVCTNSTFWNIGAEAMYVEDEDNVTATQGPEFSISNLTVHNTTDKTLYPHTLDNAILRNFIVSNDVFNDGVKPCRIYGTGSVAEYFLSYNIGNISLKDDATVDTTKVLHNTDPMYLDMSQGNFRLDENSPAVGFGENGSTLGDERWWPSTSAKIEIDGEFGDWAGLQPIEVTENDPDITDSVDIKAVWVAVDDEKISFRWDFFDRATFYTPETSGDWNQNQGWHRVYFRQYKDGFYIKGRFRTYLGSVDTTLFSKAKQKITSDNLSYSNGEVAGRVKGSCAWNADGTSVEMYMLLDSIYIPTEFTGGERATLDLSDSLLVQFNNHAGGKVFLPADSTGDKRVSGGYYKIYLPDYYIGDSVLVGVKSKEIKNQLPESYSLSQNYPNPFNPSTVINFNLPRVSNVELKVYNLLGQEVATLVNQEMNAGNHDVKFNASSLSSGIYFYTLKAGDFISSKKMLLLK